MENNPSHISHVTRRHGFNECRRIRRRDKRTRLYVDHEYITRGYCKYFRRKTTVVYLVLAQYANSRTQSCYPSLETIMRNTGIGNRNTLITALRDLESHRLIRIDRPRGGRRSNHYTLLDPDCWHTPAVSK